MRTLAMSALIASAASAATGVLDVTKAPYNCVCNRTTDVTSCIQSVLDAVPTPDSNGNTGAAVYIPASVGCGLTAPLFISKATSLYGDGIQSSTLTAQTGGQRFLGPTLVLGPDFGPNSTTQIATGPALLTGGSSSMYLNPSGIGGTRFLNFADGASILANGRSAYTVEYTFQIKQGGLTTAVGYQYDLVSSQGFDPALGAVTFFSSNVTPLGSRQYVLAARLNVAGVSIGNNINITDGTTYHLAVTYDGANVRFFLNGALQGTQAATGAIVQSYFEQLTLGSGACFTFPPKSGQCAIADAWIDGLRVSGAARYTAPFTPPTAKWASPPVDYAVQAQCNFDTTLRTSVMCQAGSMPGIGAAYNIYLPVNNPLPAFVGNIDVKRLALNAGGSLGMYIQGATLSSFEDLAIIGPRNGVKIFGQSFSSSWNRIRLQTFSDLGSDPYAVNSVYGWQLFSSNGFTSWSNVWSVGGAVNFIDDPASGHTLTNWDTLPGNDTRYSFLLRGLGDGYDGIHFNTVGVDFEASAPNFRAAVFLSGVSNFNAMNSVLASGGSYSGNAPVIWAVPSPGDKITIIASVLTPKDASSTIFWQSGANQSEITMIGTQVRKAPAGYTLAPVPMTLINSR